MRSFFPTPGFKFTSSVLSPLSIFERARHTNLSLFFRFSSSPKTLPFHPISRVFRANRSQSPPISPSSHCNRPRISLFLAPNFAPSLMPGAVALRSGANPRSKPKIAAEPGAKKKGLERSRPNPATRPPESGRFDALGPGSCSSDSSSDRGSAKAGGYRRANAARAARVAPEVSDAAAESSSIAKGPSLEKKRCSWITPYSELSWPTILKKRDTFRKLFDDFDHSSVAKFTEKKIILLRSSSSLLSEQKIRAAIENARLIRKIIEEFGSFSNYCWKFVSHKPIVNGFRYARRVPVRSPKAEAISKDLMQRGFRCVGPTVIYSFMQAAGIVNDHLSSCFRFNNACESQTQAAEVKKSIAAMSLTEA